jgi:cell division protein FtsB
MSHKGKPIILSDFIKITGDFDKGFQMMRKTAETGDDVVAAAYKDQIAHYTQMMLRTDVKGERAPVIETMRMLGEPEFSIAQEIERVWDEEIAKNKEFVEKEHKVREFVAKKVEDYMEEQFNAWVGKNRAQKVLEIQQGIHKGGPPAPAAKPEEKPKPENELSALEAMKTALEERIAELKKAKK